MKFNNNSTLVKIISYAEGESSNKAYGECYLPYEIYKKRETDIRNLSMIANELDGEYSQVECFIEIEIYTLEDLLMIGPTNQADINNTMELNELLYETLAALISKEPCPVYWPIFLHIQDFTDKVNEFIKPNIDEFELDKDTLINGFIFEAGSKIRVTKNSSMDSRKALESDISKFEMC